MSPKPENPLASLWKRIAPPHYSASKDQGEFSLVLTEHQPGGADGWRTSGRKSGCSALVGGAVAAACVVPLPFLGGIGIFPHPILHLLRAEGQRMERYPLRGGAQVAAPFNPRACGAPGAVHLTCPSPLLTLVVCLRCALTAHGLH